MVSALVSAHVPAGGGGLRLELAQEGGQVAAEPPKKKHIHIKTQNNLRNKKPNVMTRINFF